MFQLEVGPWFFKFGWVSSWAWVVIGVLGWYLLTNVYTGVTPSGKEVCWNLNIFQVVFVTSSSSYWYWYQKHEVLTAVAKSSLLRQVNPTNLKVKLIL